MRIIIGAIFCLAYTDAVIQQEELLKGVIHDVREHGLFDTSNGCILNEGAVRMFSDYHIVENTMKARSNRIGKKIMKKVQLYECPVTSKDCIVTFGNSEMDISNTDISFSKSESTMNAKRESTNKHKSDTTSQTNSLTKSANTLDSYSKGSSESASNNVIKGTVNSKNIQIGTSSHKITGKSKGTSHTDRTQTNNKKTGILRKRLLKKHLIQLNKRSFGIDGGIVAGAMAIQTAAQIAQMVAGCIQEANHHLDNKLQADRHHEDNKKHTKAEREAGQEFQKEHAKAEREAGQEFQKEHAKAEREAGQEFHEKLQRELQKDQLEAQKNLQKEALDRQEKLQDKAADRQEKFQNKVLDRQEKFQNKVLDRQEKFQNKQRLEQERTQRILQRESLKYQEDMQLKALHIQKLIHEDSKKHSWEIHEDGKKHSREIYEDGKKHSWEIHEDGKIHAWTIHEDGKKHSWTIHEDGKVHSWKIHEDGKEHSWKIHEDGKKHSWEIHEDGKKHSWEIHEDGKAHSWNIHEDGKAHSSKLQKESLEQQLRLSEQQINSDVISTDDGTHEDEMEQQIEIQDNREDNGKQETEQIGKDFRTDKNKSKTYQKGYSVQDMSQYTSGNVIGYDESYGKENSITNALVETYHTSQGKQIGRTINTQVTISPGSKKYIVLICRAISIRTTFTCIDNDIDDYYVDYNICMDENIMYDLIDMEDVGQLFIPESKLSTITISDNVPDIVKAEKLMYETVNDIIILGVNNRLYCKLPTGELVRPDCFDIGFGLSKSGNLQLSYNDKVIWDNGINFEQLDTLEKRFKLNEYGHLILEVKNSNGNILANGDYDSWIVIWSNVRIYEQEKNLGNVRNNENGYIKLTSSRNVELYDNDNVMVWSTDNKVCKSSSGYIFPREYIHPINLQIPTDILDPHLQLPSDESLIYVKGNELVWKCENNNIVTNELKGNCFMNEAATVFYNDMTYKNIAMKSPNNIFTFIKEWNGNLAIKQEGLTIWNSKSAQTNDPGAYRLGSYHGSGILYVTDIYTRSHWKSSNQSGKYKETILQMCDDGILRLFGDGKIIWDSSIYRGFKSVSEHLYNYVTELPIYNYVRLSDMNSYTGLTSAIDSTKIKLSDVASTTKFIPITKRLISNECTLMVDNQNNIVIIKDSIPRIIGSIKRNANPLLDPVYLTLNDKGDLMTANKFYNELSAIVYGFPDNSKAPLVLYINRDGMIEYKDSDNIIQMPIYRISSSPSGIFTLIGESEAYIDLKTLVLDIIPAHYIAIKSGYITLLGKDTKTVLGTIGSKLRGSIVVIDKYYNLVDDLGTVVYITDDIMNEDIKIPETGSIIEVGALTSLNKYGYLDYRILDNISIDNIWKYSRDIKFTVAFCENKYIVTNEMNIPFISNIITKYDKNVLIKALTKIFESKPELTIFIINTISGSVRIVEDNVVNIYTTGDKDITPTDINNEEVPIKIYARLDRITANIIESEPIKFITGENELDILTIATGSEELTEEQIVILKKYNFDINNLRVSSKFNMKQSMVSPDRELTMKVYKEGIHRILAIMRKNRSEPTDSTDVLKHDLIEVSSDTARFKDMRLYGSMLDGNIIIGLFNKKLHAIQSNGMIVELELDDLFE